MFFLVFFGFVFSRPPLPWEGSKTAIFGLTFFFSRGRMQGDAREKNKTKWIPTRKTFKISKKTSPKTPDAVKRPYKHNDTDLWDRGSIMQYLAKSLR